MSAKAQSLALAGAAQGAEALGALLRFAKEDDELDNEAIPQFADATKLAIDAKGGPASEDENQLYGALCKYLEGWA